MSTIEGDEDLTRKQRREQARAQRKELEEAAAAEAVRRRRLKQLGMVVGAVVVVIVVIVVATGTSKTSITKPHSAQASKTATEVSTLLGGIPQKGNVLGSPTAPVTMAYFADLQCPICKEFSLKALPTVIKEDVRTGKLKIEFHSMQTATDEASVFNTQQVAALAAGKQQKAWDYIELFYSEQGEEHSGYVTESYLQGLAEQVPGLKLSGWTAARNAPEYINSLASDAHTVSREGFTGTPSFLLGKTGGSLTKFEAGSFSEAAPYTAAVEKLIKQ